jgi:type IV secretion system protein TrbF
VGDDANVFLAARHEFANAWGDLARAKANWQRACFGALLIGVGLLGVCLRLALAARVVPWIVEVDRFGVARAFGPAEQLRAPDERLVRAQLAEFVRDVRSVHQNEAEERDVMVRAYAYVDPGAAVFLNQYFADTANNPRVIARDRVRTVEITGLLRVPNAPVYKVSWVETEWPTTAGSGEAVTSAWEAYLSVRLAAPQSVDAVVANPLGVYVTAVAWTKLGVAGRS